MISASRSYHEENFQITLTEDNLVAGDPSKAVYRYQFPGTVQFFRKDKIAISKVNIFFSWFNISSAEGNNTFSYTFTDGGGTTTYNVTIDDGYYSISDLNTYLQADMIDNGLYLVDDAGNNVYYLEIVENSTYYAVQINTYAFPTALPAGWSNPNALTFPGTAQTTQFIVPDTNFQNLIGFSPATYPAAIQTTTQSFLSDSTPQVNPVQSLIVGCSLVNNKYSNPPSLLYPFSSGDTAFGGLIDSSPNEYLYLDINPGYYNEFLITFFDQRFTKVAINDSDVLIQIVFKITREDLE